jgi:hypothetical protein
MSGENQTVCPTLKNKSWPPIMPKQRERCLHIIGITTDVFKLHNRYSTR